MSRSTSRCRTSRTGRRAAQPAPTSSPHRGRRPDCPPCGPQLRDDDSRLASFAPAPLLGLAASCSSDSAHSTSAAVRTPESPGRAGAAPAGSSRRGRCTTSGCPSAADSRGGRGVLGRGSRGRGREHRDPKAAPRARCTSPGPSEPQRDQPPRLHRDQSRHGTRGPRGQL